MATRLKKLEIHEVSLCDRGANQHARVTLFKRDVPGDNEISVPQDSDRHFNASGKGPAHDRLMVAYDDKRRAMQYPEAAFRAAWAELTDAERQAIRDEESAVEAARQAAVTAEQKERQSQMDDEGLMVKLAHGVAATGIENTVSSSVWHSALRKMAAARAEDGEPIESTVARLVKSDPDALALFRASLSGTSDDAPAAPAAPVLKQDSAYAQLHSIGAGLMAADPSLTRERAFVKAFNANPQLAQRSKTEQAFVE